MNTFKTRTYRHLPAWILISLIYSVGACSAPSKQELESSLEPTSRAPFDRQKQVFANEVPGDVNQDMEVWSFLKAYLSGPEIRTPSEPIPVQAVNWEGFLAKDDEALKWIWFGHSSLYLNLQGTLILVDMVLAPSAAPVSFLVKRFQAPPVAYQELPKPDYILISHDHYDHLDKDLVRHFADAAVTFLVPLKVGKHLEEFGVAKAKIYEFDWYQTMTLADLSVSAAPAQHFSGRGLWDRNQTLWASWILKKGATQIYYSGDSGYGPHFKEIGRRYGEFDLAFLDCGQYNRHWTYVHLLPNEALAAAQDLGARAISPVHWGVFNLALHDWFEPVEALTRLADNAQLPIWHPKIGELNIFSRSNRRDAWWREHTDFKAETARTR